VGRGQICPLGYEMKGGKIAIVEEEAELVRSIYRRYLELGSGQTNCYGTSKERKHPNQKADCFPPGVTRGGIPVRARGALYYVLSTSLLYR